ncbi:MAG: hypothetical protein FJW38_21810 [Acidobacteria bacterium]|nr:hypothetical protein [Acidobacteriota bacterium]
MLSALKIPKLRAPSMAVLGAFAFYAIWAGYHFQEISDANQRELGHAAEVLDETINTARENLEKLDPSVLSHITMYI